MKPRARTATAHADWLALVDASGPFLTPTVLKSVFPDGLDRTQSGQRVELREWFAGDEPREPIDFTRWVLRDLLGFADTLREGQSIPETLTVALPEHHVTLRPDFAVLGEPDDSYPGGRVRLLVQVYPTKTSLTAHLPGERWVASPVDRMAALLRETKVALGIVTDGDRFTLVWVPPSGIVSRATWVASVFVEGAERNLFDSFVSVLGARRFFGVAPDAQIESLLARSADAREEVTTTLGYQVLRAVELLVSAWSRANADAHVAPLAGIAPARIYEAASTVMMRLVILLTAEERPLLPTDELYAATYGVAAVVDELQGRIDAAGNIEELEHTVTAWPRLLATFRAVFAGVSYDELRLPAYGGRLFDPDRFPFLEGRADGEHWRETPSDPLPVDDRTMYAVLRAVQFLEIGTGRTPEVRRLSFLGLEVEQIGHVYEGLLDHGVRTAEEVVLGLVGKRGAEAEVRLDEIDAQAAKSREAFVEWLGVQTAKTPKAIEKALNEKPDELRALRLRAACEHDAGLAARIAPYLGLVRDDLRGLPLVFLPGTAYVTQMSTRRDSGTAYTTRELADEVARYALEPLVYAPGPAEGAAPEEWKLKSSEEILALRVCDPAVGSGAILVAACRYLAARLVEAWIAEGVVQDREDGARPDDEDEVLVRARRAIAERCLFGVDRDAMAVEMAKLSLWLVTLAKERPFSFLDHAIQCGDSLLGITSLEQIEWLHMDPDAGKRLHAETTFGAAEALPAVVERARILRERIAATSAVTVADAEEKQHLFEESQEALRTVSLVADAIVGAALSTAGRGAGDLDARLKVVAEEIGRAFSDSLTEEERTSALADLESRAHGWLNAGRPASAPVRRCLHWPLAFPEVFSGGRHGFDAMVGNPPFLGGKRISGPLGTDYREFLIAHLADGMKGNADLVTYFFLRATYLAPTVGFLATNSISQGDTREVGLDRLTADGWTIYRAIKSTPWPGEAALEIAKAWLRRSWNGSYSLDGETVSGINSWLDPSGRVTGNAYRLLATKKCSFIGSFINGLGFTVPPDEAKDLIERDKRNADVLFPYLNGEDVSGNAKHEASRWVINFFDWSEERAQQYPDCFAIVEDRVKPERMTKDAVKYPRMVNEWWQHWNMRPGLYQAVAEIKRALVVTRVSKEMLPVFVSTGQVYSDRLTVLAFDDYFHFGVLSSGIHWWWALTYGGKHETRPTYDPTNCFETFPLPKPDSIVESAGTALDELRKSLMLRRGEGLTVTYGRLHDPTDSTQGILELRALHVALDIAVRDAFGWSGLDLDHGFHETKQGRRFTLGPAARTRVLDKLLELNHARHAEEVAAGLHDKAKAKPKKIVKVATDQLNLGVDT